MVDKNPPRSITGRKIILLSGIVIVAITCLCLALMAMTYLRMNYAF